MRKTERILSKADKRGQAAMEFLMTYGWAILAAVIVVGVLWYLLGNPANLAGNQFQVSQPLVYKGLVINTTGVVLNILNGAADTINVTVVNMTESSPNCVWSSGVGASVGVGKEQSFYLTCTNLQGARMNSDVVFYYTEGASTFQRAATGSVSGRVP
jgi:hypothetical protein